MLSGAWLLLANSIQIGHVIRIENAGEGTNKKTTCWKEYKGLYILHPNRPSDRICLVDTHTLVFFVILTH